MTWRRRYPSGNVTAAILNDPDPNRWEQSERLRATLPEPRADERGDLDEPDALASAVRAGAVAVAEFYGMTHGRNGWEIVDRHIP